MSDTSMIRGYGRYSLLSHYEVAFVALKHSVFHADVCMILPLRSLWEY